MEENQKLSKYFYIYAAFELLTTWLGAWLLTKGVHLIVFILVLQILGHIGIVYEGIKSKRYQTYRLFFGLVLPFIMLTFMLWYNTF